MIKSSDPSSANQETEPRRIAQEPTQPAEMFLRRAADAEKLTDIYRTANKLRQKLQQLLHPDGVTDERPEEAVNNGLRFCYSIGNLEFTHEVFPYHFSLHVTVQHGSPVKLRRIMISLNFKTGLPTHGSCRLLRQLQQEAAQLGANQTLQEGE